MKPGSSVGRTADVIRCGEGGLPANSEEFVERGGGARIHLCKILMFCKGYLFSSSDHIDTVISSSNSIRLPIPCVLVHDIRICHRGRDHRLLQ